MRSIASGIVVRNSASQSARQGKHGAQLLAGGKMRVPAALRFSARGDNAV
jgi:hypothetical protein